MSVEDFNPVCSSGAQWYACPSTSESKFVGCCASDPCGSNGCSQGNLRPVSFNASTYGTFPDASCGTGSQFFSCLNIPTNTSTFWGCCKSNPCAQGQKCPETDIVPAYMGMPKQFQWYNNEKSTSATPSSTASATASPSPSAGPVEGTLHTGVIVGVAVGGVVVIVAIVSLLIFCLCKRRKTKSTRNSINGGAATNMARDGEKSGYQAASLPEAPPSYSSPYLNKSPLSPVANSPAGFAHHYQQVTQAPVELPTELSSSPHTRHHYSELPAETKVAAELETPLASPKPK